MARMIALRNTVLLIILASILSMAPLSMLSNQFFLVAHAQTETPAPAPEAPVDKPQPQGCTLYSVVSDFGYCFFRVAVSWIGVFFLTVGATFLTFAGKVFDTFLNTLVIGFGQTLQSYNIMAGIEQGWQLFRDVMNIAIIGVFVFVAIMTILGSAEYGMKRLVSRVLIVAVLINFSLLFSKIIVEGTNFVSGQFARAMPGYDAESGPNTGESFLLAFGIEGVFDTSRVVLLASEKANSASVGFFYGLVGGFTLFGIGAVLLYGAFMMAARALLLIFMMLTSSVAFASFLIPSWSSQAYIGWNNWWSNLLKAAMFGPLLMVFLWIALKIVDTAGTVVNGGSGLSQVATNPATASAAAWSGVILLIIGTGLLFIAIKASSSFANSIGGFNWAMIATALPATLSSRFIAAPLGRRYVGAPALERQLELEDEIKRAKGAGNWNRAAILQKDYAQAAKVASRDFNAMNTNIAKLANKSIGMPAMLSGEKKLGGAAGIATAAAKEAAKELKGLPTKSNIENDGQAREKQVLEATNKVVEGLETQQRALEGKRDAISQSGAGGGSEGGSGNDRLLKEVRAIAQNTERQNVLEDKTLQAQRQVAEHKSELSQESAKISRAKSNVNERLQWAQGDVVNKQNEIALKKLEAVQSIDKIREETEGALNTRAQVISDTLPWLRNNPATRELTSQEIDKMSARSTITQKAREERARTSYDRKTA